MYSIRKIISNVKYSSIRSFFSYKNSNKITNVIGNRTIRDVNLRRFVLLSVSLGAASCANDDPKNRNFVDHVLKGARVTEEKIISYIKVVEGKFIKACTEYRELLKKQIEIFKTQKEELDKVGSTLWDEVVKSRSEAETIKKEIIKIQGIIRNIEQQSYDLLGTSSLLGALQSAASKLEKEIEALRKTVQEELDKNKTVEKELLEETQKEILGAKKLLGDAAKDVFGKNK